MAWVCDVQIHLTDLLETQELIYAVGENIWGGRNSRIAWYQNFSSILLEVIYSQSSPRGAYSDFIYPNELYRKQLNDCLQMEWNTQRRNQMSNFNDVELENKN